MTRKGLIFFYYFILRGWNDFVICLGGVCGFVISFTCTSFFAQGGGKVKKSQRGRFGIQMISSLKNYPIIFFRLSFD